MTATSLQVSTGASSGKTLISDASGNATWQNVPTDNHLYGDNSVGVGPQVYNFSNTNALTECVAVGALAGGIWQKGGTKLTFLGAFTSSEGGPGRPEPAGGWTNSTAVGYDAAINNNNQVTLGNTEVTELIIPPNVKVHHNQTLTLPKVSAQSLSVSNSGNGYDKIVIYDGGLGVANSMQMCGLGLSAYTLRYQVDKPGTDHVFYAATSHTTANELMRIRGNGNVRFNGVTTMGARLSPKLLSIWDSAPDDGTRHDYLGFGVSGGMLRYHVGGSGDDHVFFSATGQSTSKELMRVKGNGEVVIPGSLNVGDYIFTTNWSGPFVIASHQFRISKIGKTVTMSSIIQPKTSGPASTTSLFIANTIIPQQFRPASETLHFPVHIVAGNNEEDIGLLSIYSGIMNVSKRGPAAGAGRAFPAGQSAGFSGFSVSWCTN